METNTSPYPLQLTGQLAPKLSRGLWLVKWLLAIPHFIVLFFLWVAFTVVGVIAFFAILFTGRYPRGSVRLQRRRPPLELARRASTATARSVLTSTPRSHSRTPRTTRPGSRSPTPSRSRAGSSSSNGGCWRSRITSIVAVFTGGAWSSWSSAGEWAGVTSGGLIGLLVAIAGLTLLFRGSYPRSLYDFVLGMNRWVFRVVAYTALMTDVYPPFRLDMGGDEPPTDTVVPVVAPVLGS